ncbi:MAG TPA: V-type ATP synthase subunit A, partial [bacterium (Candidatus Stahlbacteria)]|nr:V-type ATP synthase subunit A [Candidatus Stahlbacteria bacterium]
LEEMPGEEGYPAYLASKVAGFYERAGKVHTLGSGEREGALSVIGAVSPPGGDLSDPVVQATLRVVKVFWSLEDKLAYRRHFPAISWLNSYSLYTDDLADDFAQTIDRAFVKNSKEAMRLLQEEAELEEIVRLVGIDALSPTERLVMEGARSIREDFLHQNAFHEIDTYASLKKQHYLLDLVLYFYKKAKEALNSGMALDEIIRLEVRERIARAKFKPDDKTEDIPEIKAEVDAAFSKVEVA